MKRYVITRTSNGWLMLATIGKIYRGRWIVHTMTQNIHGSGVKLTITLTERSPYMITMNDNTVTEYQFYQRISWWRSLQLRWLLWRSQPVNQDERSE